MKCLIAPALVLLLGLRLGAETPLIVDDLKIIEGFEAGAGVLADAEEVPRLKEVLKTLKNPVGLDALPEGKAPDRVEDAVFSLGAVYDCGKCDKWHSAGFATAWVIGSDGVFCTNYHVMRGIKGEIAAVISAKGEVYPVIEILIADEANDLVIFRADVKGLRALPLAKEPAPLGASVYCVSHPDQRFYTHTFGRISRYYVKRSNHVGDEMVPFMAITADYARGSSGGPILNEKNEVVGMVSNTSNINFGKKGQRGENVLQMVIKNCVPGFKIREIVGKALKSAP